MFEKELREMETEKRDKAKEEFSFAEQITREQQLVYI